MTLGMDSGARKPPAQGVNENRCRKLTGAWLSTGLNQAISTQGTLRGSVSVHELPEGR